MDAHRDTPYKNSLLNRPGTAYTENEALMQGLRGILRQPLDPGGLVEGRVWRPPLKHIKTAIQALEPSIRRFCSRIDREALRLLL